MKLLTVQKDSKNIHADVTKGLVAIGFKFKYVFWIGKGKPDLCKMQLENSDEIMCYVGSNVASCMDQLIEEFINVEK